MFFRGIVKKYTADLILLIKFKKIIGIDIGKICVNYGEISFTYGIFTPNPRELWWFCLFEISHFTMFFK